MKNDYTFLLIDDNTIDQLVTCQLLKKTLGIANINVASNGREGLNWINNNLNTLDKSLIILPDINMPEMNGFQFLTEYESLPDDLKKGTQIFMLSSTLNKNDIDQIKGNNRVTSLLSKPLSVKNFEQMI